MTESEAREIVEKYEALLDELLAMRELKEAEARGDVFRLKRTCEGVTVEWISLEHDQETAYISRWDSAATPDELAEVNLDWLAEIQGRVVWPLTPEALRRPRDSRGRFLSDWPE